MRTKSRRVAIALFALAMATGILLGCTCNMLSSGPVAPAPVAFPTQTGGGPPTSQPAATALSGGMPPVVLIPPPPGQSAATALAFPSLPMLFGEPTATPITLATLPASTPRAPTREPTRAATARLTPTASPPSLTELLCCGSSAGGTYVWSIRYPAGWQVAYIPNNPRDFLGVLISDPQDTTRIGLIPSAMTPPGTALDTGDVDEFLDAYRAQREQENPGFQEFLRQPVTGLPEGRVWAGTWGTGDDQRWASYLVVLYPIQPWTSGLPRGYLTMLGLEAASPAWGRGVATYEALLKTFQMRKVSDGSTVSPGTEMGGQAVKPFLIRWCPNAETCCTWRSVTADRENWACPVCDTPTELWQVPCH
ncbi:MAG: hypothetical protein KKA73_06745 [Chloroflexi bacterium]|nr:hypothetical protein [Chloroflexota bacterium]MBU1747370.1 hypothetical protein [Chloroflexota bacterium]MBU1878140.1 hypothetical protein [Chloroflexota bacterium]